MSQDSQTTTLCISIAMGKEWMVNDRMIEFQNEHRGTKKPHPDWGNTEWHSSCDSLCQKQDHGFQDCILVDFLRHIIRLPCLPLPKSLTASTNFWKKWMIEDRGKKGSWGFLGFPIDIWSHLIGLVSLTNSPTYSLWNHAPISSTLQCISTCGILLICTFTYYLETCFMLDQRNEL